MSENREIVDAEIIDDTPAKTVPYTVTGYSPLPVTFQQYPTYRSEPELPVSKLAIVSVVFAILAIPFAWTLVPAPIALITGYIALLKIQRGDAGGQKIAKFGFVAGVVEVGLAVLLIIGLAIFSIVAWQTDPNTTKLF